MIFVLKFWENISSFMRGVNLFIRMVIGTEEGIFLSICFAGFEPGEFPKREAFSMSKFVNFTLESFSIIL